MKKLSLVLVSVMVFAILSMALGSPVYAGRSRKDYWRDTTIRRDRYPKPRYQRYPRREIRFTGKNIDRLLFIGGIYFLSKAISERPKKEIIYVSPPPVVYAPSPQPTYTPTTLAYTTTVIVGNSTNWYVSVNVTGMELNLYPGYEQVVSWAYTGEGQYVEAQAYLDSRHQQLVGTYRGNLVGYQIPWRLNFDYGSFVHL